MRVFAPIALAGSLALAGCNTFDTLDSRPNQGPCPAAGALYDVSRVIRFDGGGEQYGNIEYTGEIIDVQLFCRYVDDQPIVAEVEIDFAFGRGPSGARADVDFPYFVAVTRTNRAVMEKQYFTVRAELDGNSELDAKREVVNRIVIPRADSTISGANFEVIVGFELTETELAFNRAGKRFRLDAGSQ